jgi:hypothetical protein
MTILAMTMRTWILVLTVHGHGPYHGHSVAPVQSYYPSQGQCESAAVELESGLRAQGVQATAVCVEGGR